MRVLLQRNLFLGGVRYRRDRNGTEIPDEVTSIRADGSTIVVPVALWEGEDETQDDGTVVMKQDKGQREEARKGKVLVLPHDAVPFTEPDRPKTSDLLFNAGKTKPVTLGEAAKGKTGVDDEHKPSLPGVKK